MHCMFWWYPCSVSTVHHRGPPAPRQTPHPGPGGGRCCVWHVVTPGEGGSACSRKDNIVCPRGRGAWFRSRKEVCPGGSDPEPLTRVWPPVAKLALLARGRQWPRAACQPRRTGSVQNGPRPKPAGGAASPSCPPLPVSCRVCLHEGTSLSRIWGTGERLCAPLGPHSWVTVLCERMSLPEGDPREPGDSQNPAPGPCPHPTVLPQCIPLEAPSFVQGGG